MDHDLDNLAAVRRYQAIIGKRPESVIILFPTPKPNKIKVTDVIYTGEEVKVNELPWLVGMVLGLIGAFVLLAAWLVKI